MAGTVHTEKIGNRVSVLTIDNPPMNPLDETMCETFNAALDEVEQNDELRAILITGAGRAFCAGDDLKRERSDKNPAGSFAHLLARLGDLRAPVIAAVNGWCVGGGLELALCCDIRIASTQASFTCAGVNMGLMVSTYRLPRLIGVSRANAMLLTGSPVDARKAELFGLVTAVHEPVELRDAAIALAARIASRAPLSVEATKKMTMRAMDMDPVAANEAQAEVMRKLRNSADHAEAVRAFREKRDPDFRRR